MDLEKITWVKNARLNKTFFLAIIEKSFNH